MVVPPDLLLTAGLSAFLFLALGGALVIVVLSTRRPRDLPLLIAGGLVVLALLVVIVIPVNVPMVVGLMIALLGTALAAVGGSPVTRRVLEVATHGRVPEGDNGGIMLRPPALPGLAGEQGPAREVLRGGTTIGYLERLGVAIAIVAGFPEAIAVVVAVKGIGRFSELAAAEARERFIIGTLASLLWACIIGGLVRLAIW
ncbi:hypothetical protein [Microbacterium sp. CFBP9034]|uniref:hypothetical protein n=1 Tax=Microbacterium sp. CFBP9034 TaxID=3096540 RepID=UPI002A6A6B9F|nr:hypothetical protein [Microbacterium sp. CFBP9034]MDY0909287.1 hypothetical protein [Microbacterium sp. CFBP9034]